MILKTKIILNLVVLMPLFCVPLSAQSSMPLTVSVENHPPLTLVGTIRKAADDKDVSYCCETKLSVTNVSGKSVVLFITTVDAEIRETKAAQGAVTTNVKSTQRADYYFRPALLEPSGTEQRVAVLGRSSESASSGRQEIEIQTATAKVLFVQFADGSTWGDPQAASDELKERREALDKLNQLAAIYRTKGVQEFVGELMKPSKLLVIMLLQQLYRADGADSAAGQLNAVLDFANLHERNMQQHE
jgi:hypothetical protein